MKTCTGPRYDGQIIHHNKWHGKFGHLNVARLDHESSCTGYGKHDRVVAFAPDKNNMINCRVDHVWELGAPTVEQILEVARKQNGKDMQGRWVLHQIEPWECGKSTDYYFVKVGG